jgi:RNA polymerase sigma factor (sigma-70 family)
MDPEGRKMIAVFEKIGVLVEVQVAREPRDRAAEINSPAFLKALLGGAPAGERAFRDLMIHMAPLLTRYISRWLGDPEAVRDVMQETFLAVHRSLPRFESKSRLTTWVYSLAHHKAMDRLSEKYRSGQSGEQPREGDYEQEALDPRPDDVVHQALLIARIRAAAEAIPGIYREAWRLRDLEGLSGEEAAEALGITPTLVRVRLHRARGLIVARLRQESPALFAGGPGLF